MELKLQKYVLSYISAFITFTLDETKSSHPSRAPWSLQIHVISWQFEANWSFFYNQFHNACQYNLSRTLLTLLTYLSLSASFELFQPPSSSFCLFRAVYLSCLLLLALTRFRSLLPALTHLLAFADSSARLPPHSKYLSNFVECKQTFHVFWSIQYKTSLWFLKRPLTKAEKSYQQQQWGNREHDTRLITLTTTHEIEYENINKFSIFFFVSFKSKLNVLKESACLFWPAHSTFAHRSQVVVIVCARTDTQSIQI